MEKLSLTQVTNSYHSAFFIFGMVITLLSSPAQADYRTSISSYLTSRTSNTSASPLLFNRWRQEYRNSLETTVDITLIGDLDASFGQGLQGDWTATHTLYRAYLNWTPFEKHRFSLGKQRIPFGVGRLWNPLDILSNLNTTSLIPSFRKGLPSIIYTFDYAALGHIRTAVTYNDRNQQVKDKTFSFKSNYNGTDIGLVHINTPSLEVNGLELEGELLNTGVGFRSESAFFRDKTTRNEFSQYVIGLDYMFPNSLYILGEYYNNGDKKPASYTASFQNKHYLGALLSGQLNPLTQLSMSSMINLDDGSKFLSPVITYSLQENVDTSVGIISFIGTKNSEFGKNKSLGYFNINIYL